MSEKEEEKSEKEEDKSEKEEDQEEDKSEEDEEDKSESKADKVAEKLASSASLASKADKLASSIAQLGAAKKSQAKKAKAKITGSKLHKHGSGPPQMEQTGGFSIIFQALAITACVGILVAIAVFGPEYVTEKLQEAQNATSTSTSGPSEGSSSNHNSSGEMGLYYTETRPQHIIIPNRTRNSNGYAEALHTDPPDPPPKTDKHGVVVDVSVHVEQNRLRTGNLSHARSAKNKKTQFEGKLFSDQLTSKVLMSMDPTRLPDGPVSQATFEFTGKLTLLGDYEIPAEDRVKVNFKIGTYIVSESSNETWTSDVLTVPAQERGSNRTQMSIKPRRATVEFPPTTRPQFSVFVWHGEFTDFHEVKRTFGIDFSPLRDLTPQVYKISSAKSNWWVINGIKVSL